MRTFIFIELKYLLLQIIMITINWHQFNLNITIYETPDELNRYCIEEGIDWGEPQK